MVQNLSPFQTAGTVEGLLEYVALWLHPDIVKVVCDVLYNRVEGTNICQTNPAITVCYRRGWLQAELSEVEDKATVVCLCFCFIYIVSFSKSPTTIPKGTKLLSFYIAVLNECYVL
jgi:hypothetical protein